MRKLLILILLFSLVLPILADETRINKNLRFDRVKAIGPGLNQRVYDIAKDQYGFMWFGTDYGLLRYDGYRTQRIEFTDKEAGSIINTTGIETLSVGKDTTLWIGTSRGLYHLDLKTYHIERPKRFQNVNIRALLCESDTVVWMGTSEGLYRYNYISGERTYFNTNNSGLSQNVVRALFIDSSGNLWVGTENKLNVLLKNSDRFKTFNLKGSYKPDIKNDLVLVITPHPGNDSLLLIGTETGLCLFNRYTSDYIRYTSGNSGLSNEVIKAVHFESDRAVYLGTDMGFFMLNLETNSVYSYFHDPFNQYSISNNEVWSVFPDDEGMIWLATSNGISTLRNKTGMFSFTPVFSEREFGSVGTRVADVCLLNDTTYLVGTGNGIFISHSGGTSGEYYTPALNNQLLPIGNINAVFSDTLNRIWLGTVAGLNVWDINRNEIFIPPILGGSNTRVSSSYISTIISGYGSDLWIGTWGGGLYKTNLAETNPENIQLEYVADLNGQLVIGTNRIWALFSNELSSYNLNTGKVERIDIPKILASDLRLSSIAFSERNQIWLGSVNELIKYDIERDSFDIIRMPVENELIVTGLLEDMDGVLWGCSSNTLFRYDPEEKHFNYFFKPGNLPFLKFILSPFREISSEEIIVCGFDGFLRFNPNDYNSPKKTSSIKLTGLQINGQYYFSDSKLENGSQLDWGRIELPNNKNNLRIEFSSFNYSSIEQVQYSCMLEGYDNNWRTIVLGSNSIEYINVAPGKYSFKVRSMETNTTEAITGIYFHIRKPILISWPFVLVYIAVIFLIVFLIFTQYHQRMRFKARMDLIQLEQEKNEQLLNSKIRFYINISHELLTSIGLVIDPIRKLLVSSGLEVRTRKMLEIVDRNAQFLKVYIDQLLNFRKLEVGHKVDKHGSELDLVSFTKQAVEFFRHKALARGLTLKLKSDFRELTIVSDEDKLHSILQNLLSNAIKYTPAGGHVRVFIKQHSGEQVCIEVQDNGIGIPKNEQEKIFERFYQVNTNKDIAGTGIGLTIVRDFTEILGGRIEVESSPGKGSLFRVLLPANQAGSLEVTPDIYIKEYVNQEKIDKRNLNLINPVFNNPQLPHLLIVDQNEDIFLYVLTSLRQKYNLSWAMSGEEALRMISSNLPDIIISEMQLPDISGIKFCREVRNNPKTSRVPVVFLTVKTETENQLKAIEAGVDIFLSKPLEIEVLDANVTNLLRRSERTKEFINRRLIISDQEVDVESKDDKLLKKVVEYIHKNITETNIRSRDISYAVGVSHSSLYRKIKRLTGNSLNEFVRHIRLQRAEKLLSSDKYTISEVMDQVGFTNHSYFARCFKNQFGQTPRDYQNKR